MHETKMTIIETVGTGGETSQCRIAAAAAALDVDMDNAETTAETMDIDAQPVGHARVTNAGTAVDTR